MRRAGVVMLDLAPATEATSAARWLARVVDRDLGAAELHDVLAAAQLCRAIDPATYDSISVRVAGALSSADLSFTAVDVTSGVLSAALAGAEGPAGAREAAARYATALRGAVRDAPQDATVVAVHLFFRVPLPPARTADLGDLDLRALVPRNRQSLARGLDLVEARTRFGGIAPERAEPLATILDGVVLDCLTRYDLVAGARALRARRYVHARRSLAVDDALAFLVATRQDDGSFGDYETTLARMKRRGMGKGAALRLRATVLLQILWTLAVWKDPAWSLHERAVSPQLLEQTRRVPQC